MSFRFCAFAARSFRQGCSSSIRKPHNTLRWNSTSSGEARYNAKKYPLITPTMVLLGIMPIFAFALGTWQVERLKWKVNFIDELEEKLQRDPMLLPRNVNLAAVPDFAYRKVYLKGRWDHAHTMLLGPRVKDGTLGYQVIIPLVRSDGTTILVDRGFVSKESAEPPRWPKDEGDVELVGMLRLSHIRNYFTPDNHPEKGEWFWADIPEMAEYAGGVQANVQPVFVEEIFNGHAGEASYRISNGIPVGKLPSVDVRNAHASYVATWYSLSAFTTIMFVRLLLKRKQAQLRIPR